MRARRRLYILVIALIAGGNAALAVAAHAAGPVFSEAGPGDRGFFGRGESGYAQAGPENWWQPAFSVDGFSRLHELLPSRRMTAAAAPRPLRHVAATPDIRYSGARYQGAGIFGIDGYMRRNPALALLIARLDAGGDAEILVERYQYGRNDQHRFVSYSMAKTVTALLIGIALAEGHIRSLDDHAETYVPGLKGSAYGETPIRHLLAMSSGVAFNEDYGRAGESAGDPERLTNLLLRPGQPGGTEAVRTFNTRIAAPGQRFAYSSAETQVLGHVLSAATGRSVAAYMEEKLWQPIGAELDAFWTIDRSGQELTYAFLHASLRDYARLALMLANGGRVGERQVVPEEWIRTISTPVFNRPQTGDIFGYGFQTWTFPSRDGSFALLGVRGQMIFVDSRRKLVLVNLAVRQDARDVGVLDTIALWYGLLHGFGQ